MQVAQHMEDMIPIEVTICSPSFPRVKWLLVIVPVPAIALIELLLGQTQLNRLFLTCDDRLRFIGGGACPSF